MACWRNADCGEKSSKTRNEAREWKKRERSVCGKNGKIEAESKREMRKS